MDQPKHVYEIYIRTTPEKLWEAITRPEMTRQFFYANDVESDWKVGSPVRAQGPRRQGEARRQGAGDRAAAQAGHHLLRRPTTPSAPRTVRRA